MRRWITNYQKFIDCLEKKLPAFIVLAFIAGIFLAKFSLKFASIINYGISSLIDGYGFIAPLAIFLILAPSLAKIISSKRQGKFGGYAIRWLSFRKILACLWAVLFTALIFRFPFFPDHDMALKEALIKTFSSLIYIATHSPYFIAIWASIIVAFVSLKIPGLFNILNRGVRGMEYLGRSLQMLIPLFMLAIGAYVYSLPKNINQQIGINPVKVLSVVNIFGFHIDPNTSQGMIILYIFGALLIGLACMIWHLALLIRIKFIIKGFSIKKYFKNYWVKVYPLLWATSSEALATPLNLYLVKKYFPKIKKEVRRFIIGTGSYLNINGTVICVFVLAGLVASILGIQFSVLEMLLIIPIVFLISYGVPGIPGELVLFAGPISILLNVPAAILPTFLALYIGLQIGLPDSFRTGNNSTDDCACALLLNETYKKRFA